MKLIKKTFEPKELSDYKVKVGASYRSMDAEVRKKLLEKLTTEQFGVCAYCQQKLARKNPTIEHHCEHSICDGTNGTTDQRMDYFNLFAVCEGKGGNQNELHCDTMKSVRAQKPIQNGLPMGLNPRKSAHIDAIKYNSNGNISSRNDQHKKEINHVLNLNTNYLKGMRRQKWSRIFRGSKNKSGIINKQKMLRLIEKDLGKTGGLYNNHFPGMSEYMKAKFCV